MRRTGNVLILLSFLALFCTPAINVQAQSDVEVSATVTETQVFQGERINFNIVVSGNNFRNVGRPQLPSEFPGFTLLSPQPSTSTSYSIVNGVASRSYSYGYTLSANTPGNYTLPSVTIDINGTLFRTNPVDVKIITRSNTDSNGSADTQPDVFIKVELSDINPVVGQQITADLVLYFKVPLEIVSYQPNSNWSTDGFWKELMSDGSNPRAESVIIGNERFRRAILLKHVLFASRAGTLTVSDANVSVTVRNPSRYSDPFNSFFGGFGTNQRNIDLKSDPVRVTVRPLPQSDALTIGAVGNFTISRRLSTSSATVGEAVEIITEIRGTGNLALISRPVYTFPDGFEIFTPQDESNINKETGQISGSRTFRDVVIVRKPGEFVIDPVSLAYFDPNRRRYVTVNLPQLQLAVNRDEQALASSIQQRDLGVQAITGYVNWSTVSQVSMLKEWWFWVGLIIPLLILLLAWFKKQEDDRLKGDINYARRVRALDRAIATLDQAELKSKSTAPDVKESMTLIQNSIYGAVADKLGLQEASMSDVLVVELLNKRNIDESFVRDVQKTLTKCSTIRFAPVIGRENMAHEIERARNLVSKICEVL